MRTPRLALAALVAVALLPPPAFGQARAPRAFTYEQAFELPYEGTAPVPADPLLAELPEITGWLDATRYLEVRTGENGARTVVAVDAADGEATVHRDERALAASLPDGWRVADTAATSPDEATLIFAIEGNLHALDAETGERRQLTDDDAEEQNPRFSPDGRWIAYTRAHDLFAYDLARGVERRLTTDGSDTVYNGWASWVYYEEILGRPSRYAAFWWSPDSRRIAFMRFDDAPVSVFPIYHAEGQLGELEETRYPKAGGANPWVRMGVASVETGDVVWMDFDERADHYLAWPFWTPDGGTLTVQWMNRGQDTIRLYNCDPATGRKTLIHEEQQPSWVRFFEDLTYLEDGSGFLLRSDHDGWDHLYLHHMDGTLARRLTSGAWRVTDIEAVDLEDGWVHVTARQQPTWDTHLVRVRLDGTRLEPVTSGGGVHSVQVAPGGRYVIGTVSTLDAPPRMALYEGDGTLVRELGDARAPAMAAYDWGTAELFTIPSGDGFDLPAYWVLPPDFDEARQYPVLIAVYGGPDSSSVRNQWPGLVAHYWAQRGVIYMSVDHRGSGHFGKRGTALMHRRLGTWEVHDYTAAARWLRSRPFVAPDRIGIMGHSYGGYVTLLALTRAAGHFNYGHAGAPVTDWRLYDTVYTERYMDTPDENPEGYEQGSVLTWLDRYAGGLRLTHGTIDDNVHVQNSLQLIDGLTRNNQRVEVMIYPGSRHRYEQRAHATRESHDFWMRQLLGAPDGQRVIPSQDDAGREER